MWISILFTSVALGGVGFMVRFLIELLRDYARETYCRIIPVQSGLSAPATGAGRYGGVEDVCGSGKFEFVQNKFHDSCPELSEKPLHATKSASGLIAFNFHPAAFVRRRPEFTEFLSAGHDHFL